MKTARTLLVLPGLAALAWGVALFIEYAFPLRPDVFGTVGWIVGGPLLNDGVVAPLTAVLGIVLSRVVPRPWRVPVVAGTVITGLLLIVAFPLLWRPYGTPPMPGLHDGNPALGLALTLAAVWLVVALAPLARRVIRAGPRKAPPGARTDLPSPQGTPADLPGTPTDRPRTPAAPPDNGPAPRGAPSDPSGTGSASLATPTEPPGTPGPRSAPLATPTEPPDTPGPRPAPLATPTEPPDTPGPRPAPPRTPAGPTGAQPTPPIDPTRRAPGPSS
ncbi:hypothetical protein [Amycolatopsis sp. NPDC098790]|uniref:hypothetical protein n=1 Tax=Amycolatopsis sp. NPDC098790 TaxID=3363939 RepID=UPI003819D6BE